MPDNYLKIINGKIDDINDIAIYSFCDFLFSASKEFWQMTKEVGEELDIVVVEEEEDLLREYTEQFMLRLEDIGLMILPKPKQIPVPDLFLGEEWIDSLETKKLILLLGAKKTFSKFDPKKIISDVIDKANKISKKENVIIIDAEGSFKRGKDALHGPVFLMTIEEWRKKYCEKSK